MPSIKSFGRKLEQKQGHCKQKPIKSSQPMNLIEGKLFKCNFNLLHVPPALVHWIDILICTLYIIKCAVHTDKLQTICPSNKWPMCPKALELE